MVHKTTWLVGVCMVCLVGGMIYFSVLVSGEGGTDQSQATKEVRAPQPQHEGVERTALYRLPVPGSAPVEQVLHTIPLAEIRQGCLHQDCIPSVDQPQFVPAATLETILEPNSLGIVVHDAGRFYPFPMLETREIVNDVLPDGTPVAVTYCPLCGTGIVFGRELADGTVTEFGVSGMLWQSNLLMYNRAEDITDRGLWSQVLGQAVVGDRAGEPLAIYESDVITFAEWLASNPNGATLTTGGPADPYGGDYFRTAESFKPDFEAATSPLAPTTRVHGVIINGQPKAYVSNQIFDGLTDVVGTDRIFVERSSTSIRFMMPNGAIGQAPTPVSDIEGFWFSWVAAHPDTELWRAE